MIIEILAKAFSSFAIVFFLVAAFLMMSDIGRKR